MVDALPAAPPMRPEATGVNRLAAPILKQIALGCRVTSTGDWRSGRDGFILDPDFRTVLDLVSDVFRAKKFIVQFLLLFFVLCS